MYTHVDIARILSCRAIKDNVVRHIAHWAIIAVSRKHNALCIPMRTSPASYPVEQSGITRCVTLRIGQLLLIFQKSQCTMYTHADITCILSCRVIKDNIVSHWGIIADSRKHNALCIPMRTSPASFPVEQSRITRCITLGNYC